MLLKILKLLIGVEIALFRNITLQPLSQKFINVTEINNKKLIQANIRGNKHGVGGERN